MKRYKFLASVLLVLFSFTACEKDLLDINDSPNNLPNAEPNLLLPSGIMWSAAKIGGDLQLFGSLWSQHYTQNNNSSQYRTIEQYNVTAADYNGIWTNMWAGGLKDLQVIQQKATTSNSWQYYIAARVMAAFDYHVLNDMYGAIPISEGLSLETTEDPIFVENKEANAIIIKMLDDAIAKQAEAKTLPSMGTADYVFQGNTDNWVKFAKSLKLKILMRDFAANQAAIEALVTENDLLTVDAKVDVFTDAENKSNPLFEQNNRKLNTSINLRASNTLLKYLQANNDPRVEVFFLPTDAHVGNPTLPRFSGLEQGNYLVSPTIPNVNTSGARLAATDAVYFMSAAEVSFLKAEFFVRKSAPDAAAAKTSYDDAVTKAFSRWGQNAATFIAAGGKYAFNTAGTAEQMLEQIITQKWVAATRSQAWDSFFDQNRTGYPRISAVATTDPSYVPGQYTVSPNSILPAGQIPRRLPYPKISRDYNANTPAPEALNTKMWWHK
ncbi:MAG: SusD/RagB family nutrient-binding outer membrane lipoprotein [Adhaeribacter sp.]